VARKKRPKAGTICLQVTVKDSPAGPERHYELISTPEERRAECRVEATAKNRARLGIALAIYDHGLKTITARLARRGLKPYQLETALWRRLNAVLVQRGLKPFPSCRALEMAIWRHRRGRT
jgi:hypothetical protein